MNDSFDWVKERAACTPDTVFERLRSQVEKDVATRREMIPKGSYYEFSFVSENDTFIVTYNAGTVRRLIRFKLTTKGVSITYPDGKLLLEGTPTLSADGDCRLKVNGDERELWQVRMAALDDLFFRAE